MLARGCLMIVGVLVLLGACALRSNLAEGELQRTVFPPVRAEAAVVHRLLGLEDARLSETRTYRDPFCQLSGLPANLLSVVARQTPDGTPSLDEVVAPMQRTLEAAGWEFEPTREGSARVGWRGPYRVQLGLVTYGAGPSVVPEVIVEVRNQDRSRGSGCGE